MSSINTRKNCHIYYWCSCIEIRY